MDKKIAVAGIVGAAMAVGVGTLLAPSPAPKPVPTMYVRPAKPLPFPWETPTMASSDGSTIKTCIEQQGYCLPTCGTRDGVRCDPTE